MSCEIKLTEVTESEREGEREIESSAIALHQLTCMALGKYLAQILVTCLSHLA